MMRERCWPRPRRSLRKRRPTLNRHGRENARSSRACSTHEADRPVRVMAGAGRPPTDLLECEGWRAWPDQVQPRHMGVCMTAAPIHLAGERLMLDPAGTLLWPATSMLVVADLHLEKGSSYARRGSLLPPWDTKVTLDRLSLLLRRWKPAKVVALGDSFHDADGSGRLPRDEVSRLASIAASV